MAATLSGEMEEVIVENLSKFVAEYMCEVVEKEQKKAAKAASKK